MSLKKEIGLLLAGAMIGGIVAAIGTNYVNFLGDKRRIIAEEFDKTRSTENEVNRILQTLADVANGKTIPPKEQEQAVGQLKEKVNTLFHEAKIVTDHLPAAKMQFDKYGDAMITLRNAAELMSGPVDAKSFVTAVDDFYLTQDNFQKEVIKHQTSYLGG